jgi:DNA-directed RNA polymerase sigma subunit (sigma70/sigma32)
MRWRRPDLTLKDVGAYWRISRERVRQIEAMAVRYLRRDAYEAAGGELHGRTPRRRR